MKLNDTTTGEPLSTTSDIAQSPAWMDAHWMAYTGNRNFKANPRMMVSAEGMYYTDDRGRKVLDGLSGLW